MTEAEYLESVQRSKNEAHEETMWGKPARDIVTGIGNNNGVAPVRAIWELVQNARDVTSNGRRAKIVFTRKENKLVFQHDGIPFTHKTIEALILQTSSKVSSNNVQVGQYGTGFLTTHLFGLKFNLTAPLLTSDEFKRYYKIEDFEIDRSATDKDVMKDKLKKQWNKTQDWGKVYAETTDEPYPFTEFRYQHEGNRARLNAEAAFAKAPVMAPYVLMLNNNVESIELVDEIKQESTKFVMAVKEAEYVESLTDGKIYKNKVVRTITNQATNESSDKTFFIYWIASNELTGDEPKREKVSVILPITEDADGSRRVIRFDKDVPQIFIYLPLLGTEDWGFNFIIHSSLFTCDKDSRDSLRLVGNGQNNDDQAESNRQIIELANKLIWQYIIANHSKLADAKYLLRASFHTQQSDEELAKYYIGLQKAWREKFETLCIVDGNSSGRNTVSDIKVLDETLAKACEEDATLLEAVYGLINKSKAWTVSRKEDMLYWSNTINRWYHNDTNTHALTIDDLVAAIPALEITNDDVSWLLCLCKYIVYIKRDDLLDTYTLVPNDSFKLQKKTPLVKPVQIDKVVRDLLNVMVPETVETFVHPSFADVCAFTIFGYDKVKNAISTYITEHNSSQNGQQSAIESLKHQDMLVPQTTKRFDSKPYSDKQYTVNVVKRILGLYKTLLKDDAVGIENQLYPLFLEYYGINQNEDIVSIDNKLYDFDVRQLFTALIYDSLFRFTIGEDKASHATWVKTMVEILYKYKDQRPYLNNYQVYPDQMGVYKYASWLKKKPVDIPDRALEIYDTIIEPAVSVKSELVAKDYQDCFVGTSVLEAVTYCNKIEDELEKKGYNITTYTHRQLIIEIIKHLTTNDEDTPKWSALFKDIDAHKGQLTFSVITSQAKKDSIFSIIQVEDEQKLQQIAELAKNPDFDRILKLGREALEREERELNDFQFKKELGSFVENVLRNELNDILGDAELKIPEPVSNEQGGQDLKVQLNGKTLYYIEVKSRWSTERSVLMSTLQHRTSYEQKSHYALCAAEMTMFTENARKHEYPSFEEVKNHLTFVDNIGALNERLKDATLDTDNQVHVAGGYQVLVSQDVIRANGKTFTEFISVLKEVVKAELGKDYHSLISMG